MSNSDSLVRPGIFPLCVAVVGYEEDEKCDGKKNDYSKNTADNNHCKLFGNWFLLLDPGLNKIFGCKFSTSKIIM